MIYNYVVYDKSSGDIKYVNQVIREEDMLIDKTDENDVLEIDSFNPSLTETHIVKDGKLVEKGS